MRLGAMLNDIVGSLFKRPVTERYPFVRRAGPARLRGRLRYDPDKGCTGCGLCSKDCPAQAIEVIAVDKAAKRFVVRYHVDRCTFCGQCVQDCRFDALELESGSWELAALDKRAFTLYYGRPEDVAAVRDN